MTIAGNVQPLPVSEGDTLYRELEIMMQRLGHLVGFREKLNWQNTIDSFQLGDNEQLRQLQKTAAKNDGLLLFWAKWTKNTVFRNLIFHPNDQGFYLPFRFDEPFALEMKGKKIWFGSSVRLLEELDWLEMTMEQLDSPEVVEFWRNFRELSRSSKEHYSPFQLENT
ncbi:MAG TPA: hypothetical protein VF199_13700 [Bacillales bacterium]